MTSPCPLIDGLLGCKLQLELTQSLRQGVVPWGCLRAGKVAGETNAGLNWNNVLTFDDYDTCTVSKKKSTKPTSDGKVIDGVDDNVASQTRWIGFEPPKQSAGWLELCPNAGGLQIGIIKIVFFASITGAQPPPLPQERK